MNCRRREPGKDLTHGRPLHPRRFELGFERRRMRMNTLSPGLPTRPPKHSIEAAEGRGDDFEHYSVRQVRHT
jgi:hypothetical protein